MSYSPADKYDKRSSIYNAQSAGLRKFRSSLAKAEAGTGLADIVVCGTSISGGTGSTRATSWPAYLQSLLTAKGYTVGGTGIMAAAGNPADLRVTLGAGWTAFSGTTTTLAQCSTNLATITFAGDVGGTVVDVYVWNGGGPGTIAWKIDGVAQTAITVTNDNLINKTTVTGLANANHTVILTCGGVGTTYVVGVDVHATSGVKVTNLGMGGSTSSNISNTGQNFSPLQLAKNQFTNALVFIEYGANDGTYSTLQSNITTGITTLNSVSDVALVAYAARQNDVSVDPATVSANAYGNEQLHRALSDTYAVPVVDLFDRFGLYSLWSALGLSADSIHPNTVGARDIARSALGLVGI